MITVWDFNLALAKELFRVPKWSLKVTKIKEGEREEERKERDSR